MSHTDRNTILLALEQKEVALVRALLRNPALLDSRSEAALRTAISLSRLHHLSLGGGSHNCQKELEVEGLVEPLRDETAKLLEVAGLKIGSNPDAEKLRPIAKILADLSRQCLERLCSFCRGKIAFDVVDREIRTRKLVVAAGGGGGVGYIYLGAFKLFEECGLTPALLAGTSIGSILSLIRARSIKFDSGEVLRIVRALSWGRLFRILSTRSRHGLPAALRFHLRPSIGKHFKHPDGSPWTLADLPIPLVATVSGIKSGVLPRPLEFYESLLEGVLGFPKPMLLARKIPQVIGVLIELVQVSERLQTIYLGLDPGTEHFDAIDAVGFSAALPGVIHYELSRRDERMHEMLQSLFLERELFRITDGFLVDNVPARAAWKAVQQGRIGTRNAFIVALDGFAPRLSTPMWLATQQLMAAQVQRGRDHAHLYKGFSGTLSPLEVVPKTASIIKMFERGRKELSSELPFITKMMQPLPSII